MRNLLRPAIVLFALAIAACAQPANFGQIADMLPPPPPGKARIYVYRWLEPYETMSWARVYLNGREIAVAAPGTMFYHDVSPGRYDVTANQAGAFPRQPGTVTVAAGESVYARIEVLAPWETSKKGQSDILTVSFVDLRTARQEMADLQYIRS